MPAASHGQRQFVLAGEVDRRDHIGDIHAAGDQGGSLIDHAVVDLASLLITSVAGTKHLAAHARYKLLDLHFIQSDWGGLQFHSSFLLVHAVVKAVHATVNVSTVCHSDDCATSVA